MNEEKLNGRDALDAAVIRGAKIAEALHANGVYTTECYDAHGNLKWREVSENLIVTQGLNSILDSYFAGSSYTAAVYMSLITAGSVTSASTYASPTVTEVTSAIIANRLPVSWSASSGGTKAATTTTFSIIGSATITGNMMVQGGSGVATVGNTSASGGVLISSATFPTAKTVSSGDSLQVSWSITL